MPLVINWIKRFIPNPVKLWLVLRLTKIHSPLIGLGEDPTVTKKSETTGRFKRALVSYITAPFRLWPDDPRNMEFSNIGIGRSIVYALNELGYVVDVVEYSDRKFVPHREYDLFIGHAGQNFETIAKRLKTETTRIYFSTGPYWKFSNDQEITRVIALRQRRNVGYPFERIIKASEEWANKNADAIICLGNDHARQSYDRFPAVFNLNNASYYDSHYDYLKKDFASARHNFLFFSGPGNVHKGLDLLLEVFPGLDAHLYICQCINPVFHRIYRRELESTANVHLVGEVPFRSSQFYELAERCAFVINPSCAEGQPGGVVECMHQGLIPVVSKESNIETSDYGFVLETCSIPEIAKAIRDLSGSPPERCAEISRKIRMVTMEKFSATFFVQNLKKIIQEAVGKRCGGVE